MKISSLICLLFSLYAFTAFAHPSKKAETKVTAGHVPINKTSNHQTHDHHHHDHHHNDTSNSTHAKRITPIEHFLSTYLPEVSKNKVVMMAIAVLIISIPSLPTFLVLKSLSKLSPNKSKDGPILNERYLRWMICLAVGSLIGDVFFGMMEHISSGKDHFLSTLGINLFQSNET